MIIITKIIIFFAVSDFFMDIHDKWKHPKCNIFCNIMQDSVLNKIIQSILHVLSFQAQCYWMDILKLHWNYTEKQLDGVHWNYTGITLKCHWMDTLKLHCTSSAPQMHLQRTPNAPPAHPKCTSNAPQLHLQRTPTAPPAHPNCTSSAPQTVHLQHTSNSAPPSTPTSFTYLHPHLQRTSTAPPSTTTFTNPCLAIISEVHLSAPQKCTPPRVRCAPPSTSAHRGYQSQDLYWILFKKSSNISLSFSNTFQFLVSEEYFSWKCPVKCSCDIFNDDWDVIKFQLHILSMCANDMLITTLLVAKGFHNNRDRHHSYISQIRYKIQNEIKNKIKTRCPCVLTSPWQRIIVSTWVRVSRLLSLPMPWLFVLPSKPSVAIKFDSN